MITTIIFDLNGVLIRSPKLSDIFCARFNVDREEFMAAFFGIMEKVRKPGAGDSFAHWKPYFDKWKINLSKDEFFDFWFSSEKEVPEMTQLVRDLKNEGMRIFIFSNNFAERSDYYQQNFSFLEEISEKVYYSWQTGFVKPDPRAYQKLLTDNDLKAEECLYFDDSEKNVEAAKQLGIKSFLFKSVSQFQQVLKDHQKS